MDEIKQKLLQYFYDNNQGKKIKKTELEASFNLNPLGGIKDISRDLLYLKQKKYIDAEFGEGNTVKFKKGLITSKGIDLVENNFIENKPKINIDFSAEA